jgi:hypothetical protein
MPDGILPSEGLGDQLEYILKRSVSGVGPWVLKLWVNDLVPTEATVLADLVFASWGGYSPVTLTRPEWTVPVVDEGCAVSTWGEDALVWYVTSGPTETNYGYALVDDSAGVIRFIQRFEEEDIAPVAVGGRVTLLPRYSLTSCACPE